MDRNGVGLLGPSVPSRSVRYGTGRVQMGQQSARQGHGLLLLRIHDEPNYRWISS